jgi:hypothetical protein
MTQCVKRVISKRGTDVRFIPNSDRNSDRSYGRYVPLATKVQRSKTAVNSFTSRC